MGSRRGAANTRGVAPIYSGLMAGRQTPPRLRKVIGVDLGGTKLLGGVVDEHLEVHDRVLREVRGMKQKDLIETVVEAVDELRSAVPDIDAVGFGIPCLIDQSTGIAVIAVNLDLENLP